MQKKNDYVFPKDSFASALNAFMAYRKPGRMLMGVILGHAEDVARARVLELLDGATPTESEVDYMVVQDERFTFFKSEEAAQMVLGLQEVKDANKLGKTLRILRVGLDMTQEAFGETLGVTGSTISNWENGVSAPVSANVEAVNNAYPAMRDIDPPSTSQDRDKPGPVPGTVYAPAEARTTTTQIQPAGPSPDFIQKLLTWSVGIQQKNLRAVDGFTLVRLGMDLGLTFEQAEMCITYREKTGN